MAWASFFLIGLGAGLGLYGLILGPPMNNPQDVADFARANADLMPLKFMALIAGGFLFSSGVILGGLAAVRARLTPPPTT